MQFNENRRASFVSRRQAQMASEDALRLAFIGMAEPCAREPRVFADTKYGARQPWSMLMRYVRQAYDAARTKESRHEVIERAVSFFQACIAHVRAWINEVPSARRDVFESAQQIDGDEDLMECRFLLEPTVANAMALIEVGRRDRQRSEMREQYLVKWIMQQQGHGPTGAA
jgi:hypothetical protein